MRISIGFKVVVNSRKGKSNVFLMSISRFALKTPAGIKIENGWPVEQCRAAGGQGGGGGGGALDWSILKDKP